MAAPPKFVYTLELEMGCWYVGVSVDPDVREGSHVRGRGALWTAVHKPVRRQEVHRGGGFDEEMMTRKYMALYGLDNVRGGSTCLLHLDDFTRERIGRELRFVRDFKGGRVGISCFVLQAGKFFVCGTAAYGSRHGGARGEGAQLVDLYAPVIELYTVSSSDDPFMLDRFTKELMSQHGIDNVRGGSYAAIDLGADVIDALVTEIVSATGACLRCHRPGHMISYCPLRHCVASSAVTPPVLRASEACATGAGDATEAEADAIEEEIWRGTKYLGF